MWLKRSFVIAGVNLAIIINLIIINDISAQNVSETVQVIDDVTNSSNAYVKNDDDARTKSENMFDDAVVETTTETDLSPEKRWQASEESLRKRVSDLMSQFLGRATSSLTQVDISGECTAALLKILNGFRRLDKNVFKLLDASGKVPPGLLTGTFGELGAFDQCLDIEFRNRFNEDEIDFRGEYCFFHVQPASLRPRPDRLQNFHTGVNASVFQPDSLFHALAEMSYVFYIGSLRFGMCVPSACTPDDLTSIAQTVGSQMSLNISVGTCQVLEDWHLKPEQIVPTIILIFVGGISFFATGMDIAFRFVGRLSHKNSIADKFLNMSIMRSTYKIFHVSTPADQHNRNLQAIHGIRAISIWWVIMAHGYLFKEITTYHSAFLMQHQFHLMHMQLIFNGWLVVDTFFCISGFLVAYNQNKGRVHPSAMMDYFRKVFSRYWRLVPLAALCMCWVFWFQDVASGPLWKEHVVDNVTSNCINSWWKILLNIDNLYPTHEMCLIHYWYVSADFQIFCVILAFAILMQRKPRLSVWLQVVLIIMCSGTTFLQIYVNDYFPTLLPGHRDRIASIDQVSKVYFRPYVHATPYLIGSLTGYAYLQYFKQPIQKWKIAVGWIVAIVLGFASVVLSAVWQNGNNMGIFSALYGSLHHATWAIVVCWIIFACALNKGGIVNTILAWKGFVPLSRLSFAVYLVHMYIVYTSLFMIRERTETAHYYNLMASISNLFGSVVLGYIATVVFESPVLFVWNLLVPADDKSSKKSTIENKDKFNKSNSQYANNHFTKV